MPPPYAVYLEVGTKRVFAGALDWPGWCRAGRDENAALEALVAYGLRYRRALGKAAAGFRPPANVSGLEVAERLEGNATTDFGAPGIAPQTDEGSIDDPGARRLATILEASWAAFDATAGAHSGAVLRKGPRGGGRELDAIVAHVLDAEKAYLAKAGGTPGRPRIADATDEMAVVREAFLGAFRARARGEPPPRAPRSGKLWSPRYAVRRSAWHALDHAWEIEDRAEPA